MTPRRTLSRAALALLLLLATALAAVAAPAAAQEPEEETPQAPAREPAILEGQAAPVPLVPEDEDAADGDPQVAPALPFATLPQAGEEAPPSGEAAELAGDPVTSIAVTGLTNLAEETLLYYLDLEPGRLFQPDSLDTRIKNLWERNLIDDITVRYFPDGDGVRLEIEVVERPLLRSIDYQGLEKVSRSDVRDRIVERRLGVTEGTPVSRGELARLQAVIEELYRDKGYRFAQVTYELETVGPNEVRAVYRVDEGDRVRIGDIDFEGNTVFSDPRLRFTMRSVKETGPISRLLRKDIYNPAKLEQDLEKIRDLYRNRGYKNVLLGDPELDVRERGTRRRMLLTIPIEEGERYRFGEITIEGNEVYSDQALLAVFRTDPGTWLKSKLIDEGLEAIRELYANTGYMFARVEPELRESGDNVADILIRIDEGDQYRVGRIDFDGNTRTMDKVLRRELRVQEGYVMNVGALRSSVYKVNQLGYFNLDPEEPVTIDVDSEDQTVDLTFQGEEADRTELQFGGGWSEFYGFFGQFSVRTQNFLGRGETLQASFQTGRRQDYFNLGYFVPWFLDRPQTIGLQVFSQNLDYDLLSEDENYRQTQEGGTLTYGRSFRLFQSFGISYTRARQEEEGTFIDSETGEPRTLTNRRINSSSVRPVWTYNSVDNRFEPTRGMRMSVSGEYAGGFLGGENNYWKPELSFAMYRPLGAEVPVRSVLGLNFEGGYIEPFGEGIASAFRFYRLGGERSVRGFTPLSILPRDEEGNIIRDAQGIFPLGGDKYVQLNLEYHFLAGGPFRIVAFTDAGQAWAPTQDLDLGGLRWSAGVELRVLVPVFGAPLRFIYAYNLDPEPFDDFEDFQFTIGSTF
ncbi:MAG TPA: outer membrane protein assembly factor BamA [Thermoanaerobaculia bacterium]|nr:outer membrane protein assembly factor BamA [Thermoanaerobaculia bacterium]